MADKAIWGMLISGDYKSKGNAFINCKRRAFIDDGPMAKVAAGFRCNVWNISAVPGRRSSKNTIGDCMMASAHKEDF